MVKKYPYIFTRGSRYYREYLALDLSTGKSITISVYNYLCMFVHPLHGMLFSASIDLYRVRKNTRPKNIKFSWKIFDFETESENISIFFDQQNRHKYIFDHKMFDQTFFQLFFVQKIDQTNNCSTKKIRAEFSDQIFYGKKNKCSTIC